MGARDAAGFLTPQNIPSHPTKHTAKSLVHSFFTAAGENKRAANRKRNPVLSDSWRSHNLVSTSRTALPGLRLALCGQDSGSQDLAAGTGTWKFRCIHCSKGIKWQRLELPVVLALEFVSCQVCALFQGD